MKGTTHARIKAHVGEGGSVSGFLEALLLVKLGPPDDEDRRKFGKAHAKRQKESEAVKAKESDEPQIQDEPEPQFTTAPEEAVVAKAIEAIVLPQPEPEPEPGARPPKRRLSKGRPFKPPQEENKEEDDGEELEDYIPPIQFF